jgi:hypothetical protein
MDLQPDQPDKSQGMQDISDKYSPGELSSVEGQPPNSKERYGKNAAETRLIPEKYQNVLKELCRKIAIQDQFARIEEVKKAAEQRFYWRGMFDVCWNEQQNTWEQPGALYGFGNSSEEDTGDISLHYPLNIYQSFGRGHITVVSEPWKIRMEAKKVDAPNALRVSSAADTMREKIEAQNSIKDLRMDAARLSWTDGRVSFYSRWITDGARFGYEDEAHDEESDEGVGEGGTPPEKKPRQPKGGEVLDAYGVLECKVPITAQRTAKKDFRQLAYEIGMGAAKSMFPWIAKGLQGGQTGPGEYDFDRTTRIAVTQGLRMLQQTGDTVAQLATWERDWIRPSFFTEIDNEADRKWVEDNYPDGCLVEWIGQTYCRSRNESMDDHWEDVHPLPGDGQSTPSCGYLLMSVQDALNDLTDLKMERAMKSIPAIWCNKQAGINLQAISKEKAGPGAHYGIELEPGQAAMDQFWAEPAPQAPADEDAMWQAIMGDIPQSLTGLYPAAIGESDPSNSTLGGIKLLQAASKGQSGLAWSSFREGYAKSMMQLIRIGAYYRASEADDEGMVKIDDRLLDLEDLRDGNWGCIPDGDESYPNTHAEKKEALQELLAMPFGPQLIASSPKNMALAKDTLGLSELEIPDAETEEDQMAAIKQMLDEPPIPLPAFAQYQQAVMVAQLTGQPAPPQPPDEALFESSMPIDPEVDDAKASYTVLQNWLRSGTGKQAKNDKPDGYKNVRLRMIAYKAQMQKDQQAQIQQQQQAFAIQEKTKQLAKTPPKDASESISLNYKDLGPSGRIQAAQRVGIDVTADEAAGLAAEHMSGGQQPPPNAARPQVSPQLQ